MAKSKGTQGSVQAAREGWLRRLLTATTQPAQDKLEWHAEAVALTLALAAAGLTLALWSYDPAEMAAIYGGRGSGPLVENRFGAAGLRIADIMLGVFGVGAWVIDALLWTLATRVILGSDVIPRLRGVAGMVGAFVGGLTLVHLADRAWLLRPWGKDAAGLFGGAIAELARAFVSTTGAALLAGGLLVASMSSLTGKPLFRLSMRWVIRQAQRAGGHGVAAARRRGRAALEDQAAAPAARAEALAAQADAAASDAAQADAAATDVAPAAAATAAAGALPRIPTGPAPIVDEAIIDLTARRPAIRGVRVDDAPALGATRASGAHARADVASDEQEIAGFPTGRALTPPPDLLPPSRRALRGALGKDEPAAAAPAQAPTAAMLVRTPVSFDVIERDDDDDLLPASALVGDDLPPPLAAQDDDDSEGVNLSDDLDGAAALADDDEAPALIRLPPRALAAVSGVHAGRATPRITETPAMRGTKPGRQLPDAAQGQLAIGDRVAWTLPPRVLVQEPPEAIVSAPHEVLYENAAILERKLADFHIVGQVIDVRPGPVVTTYHYKPAPGVKISRIANLKDDLTMSLAALRVRVVAPIPGMDVVGIEVPNKSRHIVYFRELLESAAYINSASKLTIVLGKDIEGEPVVTDLAKAPHLLVAGSTGTGKSVGINSFLASILFKASPDDVKLILIDPKVLELSVYEGIPHLLLPVIDDPHKAELALKWACREMDRRYHVLSAAQVRNIAGYKAKVPELRERARRSRVAVRDGVTVWVDADADNQHLPAAPEPEEMSQIVIVIDEFADLIMASGKEVEKAVARLAQKARAAGIHVILATQRPSTDVITGMIKANFPTRVSFQVASSIDSKVVLNSVGAESLLGMGDMLFVPPGSGNLQRCHGTWISDDEVVRLAEHWRGQGSPNYDLTILADPDADAPMLADDDDLDTLFEDAVRVSIEAQQASVSFLQRKLGIGYGRAARIIDHMQAKGIVGPSQGPNKPREILVSDWN